MRFSLNVDIQAVSCSVEGDPLDAIPLGCLKAGETGHIAWIDGEPDFVTRLAEMGLRDGTTVRMIQPGSPCILALNGQRLSLRMEAEMQIFVDLAPSGIVTV